MTWEGFIRRKHRKTFEQFLHHDNPRIRSQAEELLKHDLVERAYQRTMYELEDVLVEAMFSEYGV